MQPYRGGLRPPARTGESRYVVLVVGPAWNQRHRQRWHDDKSILMESKIVAKSIIESASAMGASMKLSGSASASKSALKGQKFGVQSSSQKIVAKSITASASAVEVFPKFS